MMFGKLGILNAFTISPWVFNFGIASSLTTPILFEVAPKPLASAS